MDLGRRATLPAVTALFLMIGSVAARAADPLDPSTAEPLTPGEFAAAVRDTVEGRTVHATVGPAETPLSLELSDFLLDHPDLSAFIVNRRKIAPYRIVMQGPRRSLADDGEGTVGVVSLITATDRRRLYYGEGVHHSLLFPDIHATAVIIMDLKEGLDANGRPVTVTTFDVFVRMRSRFVASLIKTLRPFLQRTVIGKFSKAFFVADRVGRLIAQDPDAVVADADAFPVLFDEDRAALRRMIAALKSPPHEAH